MDGNKVAITRVSQSFRGVIENYRLESRNVLQRYEQILRFLASKNTITPAQAQQAQDQRALFYSEMQSLAQALNAQIAEADGILLAEIQRITR